MLQGSTLAKFSQHNTYEGNENISLNHLFEYMCCSVNIMENVTDVRYDGEIGTSKFIKPLRMIFKVKDAWIY